MGKIDVGADIHPLGALGAMSSGLRMYYRRGTPCGCPKGCCFANLRAGASPAPTIIYTNFTLFWLNPDDIDDPLSAYTEKLT